MAGELPLSEELGEAERIAVLYAPRPARTRYHSLFLLDAQLARIALTAREPALAQLKLAWWRDVCADPAAMHGHPLAAELSAAWEAPDESLGRLVDAWEELAVREEGLLAAAELVSEARAAAIAAAAHVPASDPCHQAARRWTLVTLAAHADPEQRDTMLATAKAIGEVRLSRALRPLAVLNGLAHRALARGGGALLGDRLSPLAALRLGIFGR